MNIGSMMKLARGGMDPEALGEILAAAGVSVSFTPVAAGPEPFRTLAAAASLPSANLLELRGKMKSGETLTALLVLVPSPAIPNPRDSQSLDRRAIAH